ncbi:MAG: Slp family lipoprotein [Syntrophales bacterium]|nr:Slp family lipoprotein [Syntrophales bacterium]
MKPFWPVVLLLVMLTGCATAIAPSLQQQAGPPVDFAALSAHPEQYQGRLVILGGEVMKVEPLGQGSLMTVNQQPLSMLGNPRGAPSGGTFVVESDRYLSPATYQPKSTVKLAGTVVGRKHGFPLLKAKEVVFNAPPVWEKWYYPVPPEWYGNDPNLEYWFTPPYWDPWRGSGRH